MFLHVVGYDALGVYNNFTFAEGDEIKLNKIMENFEVYCIPSRNVTFQRHNFLRVQMTGETIVQCVTELQKRSNL